MLVASAFVQGSAGDQHIAIDRSGSAAASAYLSML